MIVFVRIYFILNQYTIKVGGQKAHLVVKCCQFYTDLLTNHAPHGQQKYQSQCELHCKNGSQKQSQLL